MNIIQRFGAITFAAASAFFAGHISAAPVIISAGATIIVEDCTPANGALDPDESVTVSFCVQNVGDASTANLVGTLTSTGGIISPSGPQNYGAVTAAGPAVCRNFTFTAAGSCGGTVTASIQFQDGATDLGIVTYTFTLGVSDGSGGFDCCSETPVISSAGATIVVEGCGPANGALDPNEIVTVSFCAQNVGTANTTNLVGTLLAGGNVTAPSAPQNYGVLTAGGPPVCRNFTFTPTGTCGGLVIATVQFQDGVNSLGSGSYNFTLGVGGVCCGGAPCVLTCPANITVSNDPNQCGAVVNFPAPTTSGGCGTVTATPPSGSFFPKGTTPVAVSSSSGQTCSFTVTVNDTQPPTINCPPDIETTAALGACSVPVNFTVSASDNCPGVVIVTNPPSGSALPLGHSAVTATATDGSGNTATCTFNVNVHGVSDFCLGNDFFLNTTTGEYVVTCQDHVLSGTGLLVKTKCKTKFKVVTPDYTIRMQSNSCTHKAHLLVRLEPGKCVIKDRDYTDNDCLCGP